MRFYLKFVFLLFIGLLFTLPLFVSKNNLFAQEHDLGKIVVDKTNGDEAGGKPGSDSRLNSGAINSNKSKPSAYGRTIQTNKHKKEFQNLGQLLSKEVGSHVKENGGIGQPATLSLRGSSTEQIAIFLDGIRLNPDQGFSFDFSTLPLQLFDSVSIIRGGASAKYGSNAIGGVVELNTSEYIRKDKYRLQLNLGSFLTHQVQGSLEKRFKHWDLQWAHQHLYSKGNYQFKSTPTLIGGQQFGGTGKFKRTNNRVLKESNLVRFNFRPHEDWRISLINQFTFIDREVPGAAIRTIQRAELKAQEKIFRNVLGFKFERRDFLSENLDLSFLPSLTISQQSFEDNNPQLGPAIQVDHKNFQLSGKIKIKKMIEAQRHNHKIELNYEPLWSYYKDNYESGSASSIGKKTRLTHSLALSTQHSFFKDRLSIHPNLRFQKSSDFSSNLSASLGLIYQPKEWLVFKSNFGNSFRIPSFTDLYYPDQGYLRGNPDLKKETAINFDIGLGLESERIKFELSYFRNDISNSILWVPISAFTIAPVNANPVITQGLETQIEVQARPWLKLSANYTYLRARFKNSQLSLPGRAKHELNLGTEISYKNLNWENQISFTDQLPIDFANSTFITQRWFWHTRLSYEFKKNYFITGQVKNILNTQSLDRRGYPLPGRSFYITLGFET